MNNIISEKDLSLLMDMIKPLKQCISSMVAIGMDVVNVILLMKLNTTRLWNNETCLQVMVLILLRRGSASGANFKYMDNQERIETNAVRHC